MKLIVGLGNPWPQYTKTRHNIGFHFLDLRNQHTLQENWKYEKKYKAELVQTNFAETPLLLCKPQTYMNLSWTAIAPLAQFYKITPKDILILHDEIDFPTARIALKFWGSAAGHNGLKSTIEKLWTKDFRRLRIGVDRPAQSSQVADRVLSNFKTEEKSALEAQTETIFSLIEDFIGKS